MLEGGHWSVFIARSHSVSPDKKTRRLDGGGGVPNGRRRSGLGLVWAAFALRGPEGCRQSGPEFLCPASKSTSKSERRWVAVVVTMGIKSVQTVV